MILQLSNPYTDPELPTAKIKICMSGILMVSVLSMAIHDSGL